MSATSNALVVYGTTQTQKASEAPNLKVKVNWNRASEVLNSNKLCDGSGVKTALHDAVDAIIPKLEACTGPIIKGSLMVGAAFTADYVIGPVAQFCAGGKTPSSLNYVAGKELIDTSNTTIDEGVKASCDTTQTVCHQGVEYCVDGIETCANNVFSSCWSKE